MAGAILESADSHIARNTVVHRGRVGTDRQTLRPTDDTAHGRYGPLRRPAEKWDRDTGHLHRGAYPSTAAAPPRCLASLVVLVVAVTDTYDGYECCSLTDLMDMSCADPGGGPRGPCPPPPHKILLPQIVRRGPRGPWPPPPPPGAKRALAPPPPYKILDPPMHVYMHVR